MAECNITRGEMKKIMIDNDINNTCQLYVLISLKMDRDPLLLLTNPYMKYHYDKVKCSQDIARFTDTYIDKNAIFL